MRKAEHKPLSFSTTMRNPARMVSFLNCIKKFNGEKLTNEIILLIVKKIIVSKLYKPKYIGERIDLNNIYKSDTELFNDKQVEEIIINSPQKHKEKGFDKGWPSRFDTFFKLSKELGFVYYEMDKKIEISDVGCMLCDSYSSTENQIESKINEVFSNSLVKYQTNNPFRKNKNENAPIPLLLNVLMLLKKDGLSSGVYIKEIPFFLCWPNKDHNELYKYIKQFREKYGYTASDEIVYEKCLHLLKSNNTKRFKMNQILVEGVDDYVRKLRITGIFSLRGMGRFLDINSFQQEKVKYIIENYTVYQVYTDEKKFFDYMGSIDEKLINLSASSIDKKSIFQIKNKTLRKFAKKYNFEQIKKELLCLSTKKASKDNYFKLIDQPTRLEFLASLALFKQFPEAIVKPNYVIDDEGNPIFTAKGGIADIEISDTNSDALVEVTLMKSKQQAANEIPAIKRHLEDFESKNKKSFSLFVAPVLHKDSRFMSDFTKDKYDLDIILNTIEDFITELPTKNQLSDFL